MGVGFGVGFWLICGPLFLIRKWGIHTIGLSMEWVASSM